MNFVYKLLFLYFKPNLFMMSSQLITLLKTFSKTEMRQFGHFVKYKSSSKDLSKFYEYLHRQYPSFVPKRIEKEFVFKKIFSCPCNDPRKIDNLIRGLSKLVKEFMTQKEMEYNHQERELLYLKALKRRKLDDLFLRNVNKVEDELKKEEMLAGIERLHYVYLLHKMRLNHPNFSGGQALVEIKKLSQAIDNYYFATKLYLEVSILNTGCYLKKMSTDFDNLLYPVSELVAFLKDKEIQDVPQVRLFSKIFETLQNKNFQDVKFIKDDFMSSIKFYTKGEKNDIIAFLSLMFYEDYRQGNKKSLEMLHVLNRFSVVQGIVLEDGYIAADLFRDIVTIACAAKKYEWAEFFIENYASCLKETDRSDTYLICQGQLYLNKKEYKDVIEILQQRHFDTEPNGAIARSLKLQAHYSLKDYEAFDRLAHSFKNFLLNQRNLSEDLKKSFKNFIRFIKKIFEFKYMNCPKIDAKNLETNISNCSKIVYKSWLLEQLNKTFP